MKREDFNDILLFSNFIIYSLLTILIMFFFCLTKVYAGYEIVGFNNSSSYAYAHFSNNNVGNNNNFNNKVQGYLSGRYVTGISINPILDESVYSDTYILKLNFSYYLGAPLDPTNIYAMSPTISSVIVQGISQYQFKDECAIEYSQTDGPKQGANSVGSTYFNYSITCGLNLRDEHYGERFYDSFIFDIEFSSGIAVANSDMGYFTNFSGFIQKTDKDTLIDMQNSIYDLQTTLSTDISNMRDEMRNYFDNIKPIDYTDILTNQNGGNLGIISNIKGIDDTNFIGQLLTMPLNWYTGINNAVNSYLNSDTCPTYTIINVSKKDSPLLGGLNVTLPCGEDVFDEIGLNKQYYFYFGSTRFRISVYNLIDSILSFTLIISISQFIIRRITKMTNFEDDFDELYTPNATYNPKGGGE